MMKGEETMTVRGIKLNILYFDFHIPFDRVGTCMDSKVT